MISFIMSTIYRLLPFKRRTDNSFVRILPKLPNILLVGMSARLICVVLVLIALWGGFFWATSTPGSL